MASHEVEAVVKHQYVLDLIKRAENVPLDDERVVAYLDAINRGDSDVEVPEHEQYGNNFFMLFVARHKIVSAPNGPESKYIRKALNHGDRWSLFTDNNSDLLASIDTVLERRLPYSEIRNYRSSLVFQDRDDLVQELEDATDHPFGLEGIGIAAWDKINPLLEVAAEKMKESGIPPESFFS